LAAWIGWSSAALFLAIASLLILATLSARIPERGFGFRGWVPLVAATWATIGARIASRQPRNPVGWLLLMCGWLWAVTSLFEEYAAYAYVHQDPALPALSLLLWFNTLTPALVAGCSGFAMLLLPDGRLPSRRWRGVVLATAVLTVVVVLGYAVIPRPTAPFGSPNPFGIDALRSNGGDVADMMNELYVLRGAIVLLPTVALLARLRTASGDRRRQLGWVATAATLASGTFYLNALVRNNPAIQFTEIVALGFVPVAFAVAITRYRLYEIDHLVHRAFVYGGATGILAGFYLLAMDLSQRAFVTVTGERSDAAIIVTTLIAALAFAPLKDRLQRTVDRSFKSPVRGALGLERFDAELQEHLRMNDREGLLAQFLTECVAAADATGGVLALGPDGTRQTAKLGRWSGDVRMTIVVRDGESPAATILLGPRADGLEFSEAKQAKLNETADLVGKSLRRLSGERSP
jgi:hypothetical protein